VGKVNLLPRGTDVRVSHLSKGTEVLARLVDSLEGKMCGLVICLKEQRCWQG
jgi:hypothetical protein